MTCFKLRFSDAAGVCDGARRRVAGVCKDIFWHSESVWQRSSVTPDVSRGH
jgi:hypothetical protein